MSDASRTSHHLAPLRRALVCAYCATAVALTASSAELPVACVAGSCGANGPASWLTSGNATATYTPNSLTVHQTTDNAVLNWQSFNVSSDGSVTFQQPNSGSIALNRIYQNDPSRIFGALNANGRVFLLNQNGILFGAGARVNVGGLVASTLDMTPAAIERGIAGAITTNDAAFVRYRDAAGNALSSGPIEVAAGATIVTPEGGQVLMFAPHIQNSGTIRTPGGQAMLAAGNTVYLATSNDPNLRGLLVEVDAGGDSSSGVTNGVQANAAVTDVKDLVGQIVAERGNVTLAGLAVNQLGRVSATTTVRQNGSIRLQAREGTASYSGGSGAQMIGVRGGDLTLGMRSVSDVTLDRASTETTVDANEQPHSLVQMAGGRVNLLTDSLVTATGGLIAIKASEDQSSTTFATGADATSADADHSRVYLAAGARLDVSGASLDLPMERNVLRVELRGTQLRDNPAQRDGPLRGQTVYVDVRQSGVREDGTAWQGTPIADVSGDISTIARSVAERNAAGGSVLLQSQGDVILAPGVAIDVSGGVVSYQDGYINTTQLLGANGRLYDIGSADSNRAYLGTSSVYVREHSRWGVTESFTTHSPASAGRFERGYVEGRDAGALSLIAPHAILDGSVIGEIVAGPYQREPTAPLASGPLASGQTQRPYSQLPRGARVDLGRARESAPEFVLDSIAFGGGSVLPTLLNDAGERFDPLRDLWPQDAPALQLRAELFGPDRIAEATLFTSSAVTLPQDVAITLPAGGALNITAPGIAIEGSILAPSGAVSAVARPSSLPDAQLRSELRVGAASRIDVSGGWVNDNPLLNRADARPAALHIDGGSVRLNAQQGDLVLERGSVIDVSGGVQRAAGGALNPGRGGSISLSSSAVSDGDRGVPTTLDLGAELRGYAMQNGGRLSIAANAVCIATTDCAQEQPGTLWLSPQTLTSGGFSQLSIASNRDGLVLADDTQLSLRQLNYTLAGNLPLRPTGAALDEIMHVGLLDDLQRRPTGLRLTAQIAAPAAGYSDETFAEAGGLVIGSGAIVDADPGAQIALQANTRLSLEGSLLAPAGSVSLLLDESLPVSAFLSSQTISLGAHAVIDTSGVARVVTNDQGVRSGEVLDGGTIAVTARRGYVLLQPGSSLDVSGTSAELDLREDTNSATIAATRVGSAAGRISLTAAEGILVGGTLSGRPGEGTAIEGYRASGGTLEIVLEPNSRADPLAEAQLPSLFPLNPRGIVISSQVQPVVVAPGSGIPESLNGQARLSVQTVADGGFDHLSLRSAALSGRDSANQAAVVDGRVQFDRDVALSVAGRLSIDAARIQGAGDVTLQAAYLAMGNGDRDRQFALTPDAGTATLTARARAIELFGNSVLDGFGRVSLVSDGDLRLRGLQQPATVGRGIVGSLLTAGDLTIRADQLYATTLSEFELGIRENSFGTLQIQGNDGDRGNVLSAGSVLRLSAPRIVQEGVLRAPFGTIDLRGDDVVLADGSLTSTSADGLAIPFGTTQGGFDWVYELEGSGGGTLVFGADELMLPSQQVQLQGSRVTVSGGATVDLSGGGDLVAYEFVPGIGGSRDVLSASINPEEFAIVPGLSLDIAAYDQREYRGSGLQIGDSVHLDGTGNLPSGEYVLLPARYALLPGAYLVRSLEGYLDLPSDSAFARLDGSTVVSGFRTLAGTPLADTRRSAFAVRAAAAARAQAQYTTQSANAFFASPREASALPVRLPRDGGVLALTATQSLQIEGTLRAQAAESGRGAAVDISGSRLRVVADSSVAAVDGEVLLDADSLSRLGAQSVLLGARRVATDDATQLEVAADVVTIEASVSAPELLLAARDSVIVESGATLQASGTVTGEARYSVVGDGALLRVAAGEQAQLARSESAGAQGVLDVRDGARIEAEGGSVLLDSSRDTTLNGALQIAGGSLNLSAGRIHLADDGVSGGGLVLSASELAGFGLDELVLTSRSSVDLHGGATLDVNRLVIDAAGLRRGAGDGEFVIAANDLVRLLNGAGVSADPAAASMGTLRVAADTIEFGPGEFSVQGFDSMTFAASGDVIFQDGAKLRGAGDAELIAARLTAASGARADATFSGNLRTRAPEGTGAAALAAVLAAGADDVLGARLELAARSIRHEGAISLPSGYVTLSAEGTESSDGVMLAAGSVIDARGRTRVFDDVHVSAPGGTVAIRAAHGDVTVASDALIDVSGTPEGGDAGHLSFAAAHGSIAIAGDLRGDAVGTGRGGAFDLDAVSFGGFDALNRHLRDGGFSESIRVRQRGAGDIVVAAGEANEVRAHSVELTAEQGAIRVDGALNASGARAGRVRLAARDSIVVNGAITTAASAPGERGGSVDLWSDEAGVIVEAGARIDVSGGADAAGGEVRARLPRTSVLSVLDAQADNDLLRFNGALAGARRVSVEGFEVYDDSDGILSAVELAATDTNPRFEQARTFMNEAVAVRAALGRHDDASFEIRPGVEVRSEGDLALAAAWNLYPWRFADGVAGVLTLRAGGNLLFDQSLSDAFSALTGTNAFSLPETPGQSWTYRLAGGADLSSVDPLSVVASGDLPEGGGDVRVAAGTTAAPRMIRTGTGDIEIAAGGDFVLGNRESVVYTAGVSGPGIRFGTGAGTLVRRAYPIDGGDISINAGRDIIGASTNQLVTDWLWRVGTQGEGRSSSATAWTVNFQRFQQNVGALAGGDVHVSAARDIDNFSVSIPTIGRQIGGAEFQDNLVEVTGGGHLDVSAGGSIRGGSYYVGRGDARLAAADEIRRPDSMDGTATYAPLLALGDGAISVTARGDLTIEGIVNPTLLPQGVSQSVRNRSYFSTYAPDSRADLTSIAGTLLLDDNSVDLLGELTSMLFVGGDSGTDRLALRVMPPSLRATALSGDVVLDDTLLLYPAPKGNVEIFGYENVRRSEEGTGRVLLALPDTDPAVLPLFVNPAPVTDALRLLTREVSANASTGLNAPVPVHADENQPDAVPDRSVARIVAATGDIEFTSSGLGDSSMFYFSKAARLVAGRDLIDVAVNAQHVRDTDVTVLSAGRDIRYSVQRTSLGQLQPTQREIVVDGGGTLQLTAGRNIDLQTSGGVTTRGNLANRFLAEGGADISVLAGLNGAAARYDDFIGRYIAESDDYANELIDYVERVAGASGLTQAEALARFRALGASLQRPLIERVLFAELRTSGRDAAKTGSGDFSRALAALETLFPGSNPDVEAGETNAYAGDVRLFFSRLYTLAGGDIDILAPGGEINVGLATPPASFGVSKLPSELGIVAQSTGNISALAYRDFLVNESRTFAADGGDILVWSTDGDIDAGRGAKTAISAPPPTITIDENGRARVSFPPALTGSGIQTLATSLGREPGDVDLFAPRGVVNAGDAGIVAGNLTIAATAVLGVDNIRVSGVSVGVPVDAGGLGASLAGVSSVASSASNAATGAVETNRGEEQPSASLADTALSWLEVFVVGLGEEGCRQDDIECLKRQKGAITN